MFARELSCNQVLIVEQYLAMKLFSFDRIGKALKTNMSFHAKFWYIFSVYFFSFTFFLLFYLLLLNLLIFKPISPYLTWSLVSLAERVLYAFIITFLTDSRLFLYLYNFFENACKHNLIYTLMYPSL